MIMTSVAILALVGIALLEKWVLPYLPIMARHRPTKLHPQDYGFHYESADLEVENGVMLKGYFLKAKRPKATIICIHGIGGVKENLLALAKQLVDNQYNCLLFDQRAHGKSGGQYCTFGWYEKLDVVRFVDWLARKNKHIPIGIYGHSMGGAVALQSLAIDKRLRFGIIESTFNTLENVVSLYSKQYLGFKSRWLARRALAQAAKIALFQPFKIEPRTDCQVIEQPILMAHGDLDANIPIELGQDNFRNLKSTKKEFIIVAGATHDTVRETGGQNLLNKTLQFLRKSCRKMKKARSC